jgi:hypothetical protein
MLRTYVAFYFAVEMHLIVTIYIATSFIYLSITTYYSVSVMKHIVNLSL